MKRLLLVYFLLILSLLVKGQYQVVIFQKAVNSIQIYHPTLIDTSNQFSPREAYERLNQNNPKFVSSQLIDTSKTKTGWCTVHLTQEGKSDLVSLSAFVHKSYGFIIYSTIDSGKTFTEIPKNINRINARFSDTTRIGDTLLMPPIKSKYFPSSLYVNYLVTLQELEKRKSLILLVKVIYKGAPQVADIEVRPMNFVKPNRPPPAIHDWLKVLLIISAICSLAFLVMSKKMVYLIFFGVVLSESFLFYLRYAVRNTPQPSISFEFGFLVSAALFYVLYACIVWKKWRVDSLVKVWTLLGAIHVLLVIVMTANAGRDPMTAYTRKDPIGFFFQNRQVIDVFIIIGSILIITSAIIRNIRQNEGQRIYQGLLFLLLLPLIFSLYLILQIKVSRSFHLYEWYVFVYLVVCFVLLSYQFWLLRKEAVSTKMAQALLHQRAVSEEVIHALEEERKRLAKDLHDDLGGNLAAIKIIMQATPFQHKSQISLLQLVDQASENARNIAHNLMPPHFESTTLCIILSTFYQKLNEEAGIKIQFICRDYVNRFSKDQELIIYRILMELTNNILRHAQATEGIVQLMYNNDNLELLIEDNGIGIHRSQNASFGLKSIESRVAYLEGNIRIDSSAHGTTIIIHLPYPQ